MISVWNAIKTASKLKLGLANPYKINPQHCMISEGRDKVQATFQQMKQINRNTYLARFQLPEPDKCLGLMIGENLSFNIGKKSHRFNPVSRIDEPGLVDIFVSTKQASQKEFAEELQKLKQGNRVILQNKKRSFTYHGYGKVEWNATQSKTFKHIGIVAYDMSITKVYTLIDSLMPNYDNHTGISLLWIAQNPEEDFIFLQEFSMLAEQYKLNLNLMLKQNRAGWIGPFGTLNSSHLKAYMPPPTENSLLILLGNEIQIVPAGKMASEFGYKDVISSSDQ